MEAVFQHWLDVVCELHLCVIQTSHDASEKLAANQSHMVAAKAKLTGSEKAEATAQKTVDDLGKMDTATEAYKLAVAQFPSGWDLVRNQVFMIMVCKAFVSHLNWQFRPTSQENSQTYSS